jgi:hypothetical protein
MSIISDILSGKLFKFRTATGSDVDAGTSDKLIITPLSLKNSSLGSGTEAVASMHFGISNPPLITGSTFFSLADHYELTPDTGNGYFYTGRGNVFTARLFVYAKIDNPGGLGEACLYNVSDNTVVSGSTVSFGTTAYVNYKSADFNLLPNKAYAVGIRRSSAFATNAYLRAALVTIKIPKA